MNIFELKNMLDGFCKEMTSDLSLYPNKVCVSENKGKKEKDKTVSLTIQIAEKSYPEDNFTLDSFCPIARVSLLSKGRIRITLSSEDLFDYLKKELNLSEEILKKSESKKSDVFSAATATFEETDEQVIEFLKNCILYSLDNYKSTAAKFGCCSRFKECSKEKRCIHPNKLYSTVCEYRKNLEKGNNFLA